MKRFIFLLLLAVSQQSLAGNCEKLLCVSTGAGRTGVEECKNNSLRELYQDVWNTYNENYCYQTNAILNGGNWACGLSDGKGKVASVSVYTICIEVYGVKVRIANLVNVNAMPGAIVVGGNGTPIGGGGGGGDGGGSGGGSSGGGSSSTSTSVNFQSFTVEDDDDDEHTVSGNVTCKNGACSPHYNVD